MSKAKVSLESKHYGICSLKKLIYKKKEQTCKKINLKNQFKVNGGMGNMLRLSKLNINCPLNGLFQRFNHVS